MEEYGVIRRTNRAEIDTTSPFRSVKEAVMLFGERVLAGEVYANKLKEMRKEESNENGNIPSKIGTITAELEETKQNLEKAREQSMTMAISLSCLQEELENTKSELQQLKERELEKQIMDEAEADEDLKFVEDSTRPGIEREGKNDFAIEFQKKRYVTFASPPTLAKIIVPEVETAMLQRHPSLKKKSKKLMIPLIGGLFSRKK